MKKLSLWLFLALAVLNISGAGIEPGDYRIGVEKIDSPGRGQVSIRSLPAYAVLSVDGAMVGSGKWSGNLSPGIHGVSAEAKDHFPIMFLISVAEHAKYTIDIALRPHTGFLAMSIEPSDAEVYVEGKRLEDRLVELPVGQRDVTVKKFGYKEEQLSIDILRNITSAIAVTLEASEFRVTGFRLSPLAFDPLNRGLYGRGRLDFSVAAPGMGKVEIFDASGSLVHTATLPEFATWSQRFTWKGEDGKGQALPYGGYTLALSVWPRDENQAISSEHPLVLSREINLVPDRMVKPMGFMGGRAGLAFFPEPALRNTMPGSLSILGLYSGNFSLDAGFRVGERIGLGLSAFASPGGQGASGGVTVSFTRRGASLDGAVSFVFASSATNFLLYPDPGIGAQARLEFPLALTFPAKAGEFRFGAAPGLNYHIDDSRIGASLALGFWHENRTAVAGLSAFQSLDARGILNSSNPLSLAAEGRFLFASLPFTLHGIVCASLSPGLFDVGAGLGMGLAW
ncbi:MAG: PEGA domain-containing protein [Spirochaetes bacterium]|nr:MAG: PEGA domain-containing protein [Spirochaetota bacterium]